MRDGCLVVRWQERPEDLPRLEELFAACFPKRLWSEEFFHQFKWCQEANNCIKVLVNEYPDGSEDSELLGAYLYTCEQTVVRLKWVAVHPAWRRRGIGAYMLSFLIGTRSGVRRKLFTADVAIDDVAAQMFFKSQGFKVPPRTSETRDDDGHQVLRFEFHKILVPVTV